MLPFAFPFTLAPLPACVQIMPNRFNCPIIPAGAQNGGVTRTDADNEFSVRDAMRCALDSDFFLLRRHQLAHSRRHQHLPQGPVIVAAALHYIKLANKLWGCQTSHVDLVRQGNGGFYFIVYQSADFILRSHVFRLSLQSSPLPHLWFKFLVEKVRDAGSCLASVILRLPLLLPLPARFCFANFHSNLASAALPPSVKQHSMKLLFRQHCERWFFTLVLIVSPSFPFIGTHCQEPISPAKKSSL